MLIVAIFALTIPTLVHSAGPPIQRLTIRPAYVTLQSRVDTLPNPNGGLSLYPLISANFTVPFADNATIFYSVGTFVQPSQCCPGAYLSMLSIDGGTPGTQILCGADTSRFTGVLSTLSCFGRMNFSNGAHTVTLVVGNGGGIWTVEKGPTTSILVQFD